MPEAQKGGRRCRVPIYRARDVLDKSALYGSSLELFSATGMADCVCHAHRGKKTCEAAGSLEKSKQQKTGVKEREARYVQAVPSAAARPAHTSRIECESHVTCSINSLMIQS